jgi:hypothetical protein
MSNSQSVQPPTIEPSQNQVHQDGFTHGNGDSTQRSGCDSTPDMMQYPSSMARQSFTMSGSGKEVFENENDDRVIIEFGSYLGRRNG